VIRIPVLYDRLVAATVFVTIAAAAGLAASIGLGSTIALDIVIILTLLGYAAIMAFGTSAQEAAA
jgi:multisubunit Na+/H+ antiporter MnhF subunit